MILISKTYETWNEDAYEHGDTDDRGFLTECEECTFLELVALMEEHPHCSSGGWHHTPSERDWFSSDPESDWQTGEETVTAIHYHKDNVPGAAKYWRKAAALAEARRRPARTA